MQFVIGLLNLINWKKDNYYFILVIVDLVTKMVYYKLAKTNINALKLTDVIIDFFIRYQSFLVLIMTKEDFIFILKF